MSAHRWAGTPQGAERGGEGTRRGWRLARGLHVNYDLYSCSGLSTNGRGSLVPTNVRLFFFLVYLLYSLGNKNGLASGVKVVGPLCIFYPVK